MLRVPKTAIRPADDSSTQPAWLAEAVPAIRDRSAVIRWLTGFTSTNPRSQPGIVAGLTNALLARVSGNWMAMLMTLTAWGDRSSRPRVVQIHETLNAKTMTSAT